MRQKTILTLLCALAALLAWPVGSVFAQASTGATQPSGQGEIRDIRVREQGGTVYVRIALSEPPANPPASFSVTNPARLAFDFPGTRNALGRTQQDINQGELRSARLVEAGDRTRLVLNLARMVPYETRVEGSDVVIALSAPATADASSVNQALASFAVSDPAASTVKSLRDIQFRRGQDGEGRIVVSLSDPDTGINVRQQGSTLVVDFLGTSLPEHLQRRSDVTDFGTPVSSMTAQPQGQNARLVVTPSGMWEHNAYQTDTQFVLEVRRVAEDPSRLVQGTRPGEYAGERLSLNFQDVNIRSVLQVIADFTDFNIVTSDSVQGNLTLRLQDVPWDQALDIILQAKGLDKRKTGNVIWIAPSEELAARERMQLESLAQIGDLEQLRTEMFQINYHSAKEIFEFLRDRDQTVLSERGSVVVDDRTNKLFVTDVNQRLDAVRDLVREVDIAPRQVLIEARIVEAVDNFAHELGVRLGARATTPRGAVGGRLEQVASGLVAGNALSSGTRAAPPFSTGNSNVRFPVSGDNAGLFSVVLWNSSLTRFLDLEISALETTGNGKIISRPRIMTANMKNAVIKQGARIPYQTRRDGEVNTEFIEAVLALDVTPRITPDGRVILELRINKDEPDFTIQLADGSLGVNQKEVTTEVTVDNGGTVVIGGIFQQEISNTVNSVPVLGDVPVLGRLFRNNQNINRKSELMVFITPRIVSEELTLR